MTKFCRAILASVFVATFSWAADLDGDGVQDSDDPWPNNASLPKLSSAWGAYGESWSPSSALGFHGFAGYHDGEDIPTITRIVGRVTDHGATGNDTSDDTQAFTSAIAAANSHVSKDNPGVLLIPAGDYYISQELMLDTPGLVLRGEGRNTTTLYSSVLGGATIQVGDGTFDWEYEEHWISDLFAKLDNNNLPQRGDTVIRLASALSSTYYNNLKSQNFRAGIFQTLQVSSSSATPQLMENLYGGPAVLAGSAMTLNMRQVFEVSVSSDKKTLYLDRPLRFSPSDETIWNRPAAVCLRDINTATEDEEIGVEDLTVIIANRDYSTHFMPNETTGISFEACHSWAKNLRVHNADVSVFTHNGSHNNTIKDIEITADRDGVLYGNYQHIPTPWQKVYGHYAVALMGFDNLADVVSIDKPRIHDTSFGMTQGCVYSRISGTEINFDHHRLCPYDNLATEIDIGDPYRMWSSSGDDSEGWRTAADNVYWGLNISTTNTLYWPGMDPWMEGRWGYYRNAYIATGMPQDPNDGFLKDGKTITQINPYYDPNDVHFEGMSSSELFPKNLYFAQRQAYFAGNLQCPGWEVNVTHNNGGSIMPEGTFHVPNASTPKYFFEAKSGYRIDKVLVNGQDQGALTEYAFSGISADSTLEVVFVLTNAPAVVPVANAQSTNVLEDASVGITLSGVDDNGDPLFFSLHTQPAKGVLSGTAPNLIYAPDTNFFGLDSFTFTVSDGSATSAAATVSITVNAVNDDPVFSADPIIGNAAMQGVAYVGSITASDVDGDPLTYSLAGIPSWLTVSTSGVLGGTPGSGDVGPNSFTIEVDDGNGGTDTALLEINVLASGIATTVLEQWNFDDSVGTRIYDATNIGSIGTAWDWADTTWVTDGSGALMLTGAIGNDWKGSEDYSPYLSKSGTYSYEMTISAWSHDAAAAGSSLKSKIRNPAGQTMAEVQFRMAADKAFATINSGNSNYRDIDLGGLNGGPVSIRVDFNVDTLTSEYFVNGDSKYTFSSLNASVMTNGIKEFSLSREGGWASPAMTLSIDQIQLSLEGISVDVDTDGDGLTDAQEIALGTDPNDPDSGFGIDGNPLPGIGKIQIAWPSATGVLYKVWNSPDLGSWSVARDWTNALTPPEDTFEFDGSPSNGFFKVEAEIQ